jgi:hypothetical protein
MLSFIRKLLLYRCSSQLGKGIVFKFEKRRDGTIACYCGSCMTSVEFDLPASTEVIQSLEKAVIKKRIDIIQSTKSDIRYKALGYPWSMFAGIWLKAAWDYLEKENFWKPNSKPLIEEKAKDFAYMNTVARIVSETSTSIVETLHDATKSER